MNGNGKTEADLLQQILLGLQELRDGQERLREELRAEFRAEIGSLRSEMHAGFAELRSELRSEMHAGFAGTNERIDNVIEIVGTHHADHAERIQALEAEASKSS